MIHNLMNIIQREVQRVARRMMPGIRFGIVDKYDPTSGAVQVQFPDDPDPVTGAPTVSPWMPIIMPSAGPGAGDIAAPPLGSQAIILSIAWGSDRYMFMLGTVRAVTDTMPPQPQPDPPPDPPLPNGPPSGERWITHPNGQSIMLRNDGTVLVGQNTGAFQRLATEEFVLSVFNNHTHKHRPGSDPLTETEAPTNPVPSGSTTAMTATAKAN